MNFVIEEQEVSEFVFKAYEFAKKAHEGQVRKYTGVSYITHPVEVMQIVSTVTDDIPMLCAALMHDLVEDCDVTFEDIRKNFGVWIAELVEDLPWFYEKLSEMYEVEIERIPAQTNVRKI